MPATLLLGVACLAVIMVVVIVGTRPPQRTPPPPYEDAAVATTTVDPIADYSPTRRYVYAYLADKVYIQNPATLRFIDSTLFYASLNAPVYYRFLDTLNALYRCFVLYEADTVTAAAAATATEDDDDAATSVACPVGCVGFFARNTLVADALQLAENAIAAFHSLRYSTPIDLLETHRAQEAVLHAILATQLRALTDRANHANFDQESTRRWYVDRPAPFGFLE